MGEDDSCCIGRSFRNTSCDCHCDSIARRVPSNTLYLERLLADFNSFPLELRNCPGYERVSRMVLSEEYW